MSIQTNPMEAISMLLKQVKSARSNFLQMERDEPFDAKLEKLAWELNNIKDLFMRVKKNEEELLHILTEVDEHLHKLDKKRLEDMEGICKRIRDSAHKLLPMDANAGQAITKAFESSWDHKTEKLHSDSFSTQHNNELLSLGASQAITKPSDSSQDHKSEEVHSDPSSSQQKNELLDQHKNLIPEGYYDMLDVQSRYCLLSLSIFPEHAVINKRHTIYWWIGEGLVEKEGEKTAEEVGEDVIDELLKLNLIVPYGNGKCPLVNKFKMNPHICHELEKYVSRDKQLHLGLYLRLPYMHDCLVLKQHKVVLGDGFRFKPGRWISSVFNVGASYLNFGSKWLAERKDLLVLQLGRWQNSPSHHIEVGSEEFLKELRDQNRLKYLSLRGISRISELPPSIAKLESLEILDLKACHNLETLPIDVASMKSLTHLILSQCYLLEGMPKGIEKLIELQVLKGFIIGSLGKTRCKISDLANLKKLKKLSIHIGSEAVIKDKEFESLQELSALKHLKISWGVSDTKYSDIKIILPSSLKKLHLEGFPGQKIPEWLKPSKQPGGFKELKLKGGKLRSLNHDGDVNKWGMEIVHLKYLKHLKVDLTNLRELFPSLRYAEIKQISNHSYFEWIN